jgi:curli production assembly/transport component CsgG
VPKTDMFGSKMDNRRGVFGAQIASTSLLYKGDFPDPVLKTGGEIGLVYSPNPTAAFHFNYGFSRFKTKDAFESKVSYFELATDYRIFPHDSFTPYLSGGLGLITQNENTAFDFVNVYTKAQVGAGLEYLITKNVGVRASLDYHFIFSDEIDNMEQGRFNDFYWRGNIGINFYFGKPLQGRRKFSTGKGKSEGLKDDGF